MRPPGYEPGELPTAPLRDVKLTRCASFLICGAKVRLFCETCKLFAQKMFSRLDFCRFLTSLAHEIIGEAWEGA